MVECPYVQMMRKALESNLDGIADELNDAHDGCGGDENDGSVDAVEPVNPVVEISMLAESPEDVAEAGYEPGHLYESFWSEECRFWLEREEVEVSDCATWPDRFFFKCVESKA